MRQIGTYTELSGHVSEVERWAILLSLLNGIGIKVIEKPETPSNSASIGVKLDVDKLAALYKVLPYEILPQ